MVCKRRQAVPSQAPIRSGEGMAALSQVPFRPGGGMAVMKLARSMAGIITE
jgi:hypothetical protein